MESSEHMVKTDSKMNFCCSCANSSNWSAPIFPARTVPTNSSSSCVIFAKPDIFPSTKSYVISVSMLPDISFPMNSTSLKSNAFIRYVRPASLLTLMFSIILELHRVYRSEHRASPTI